MQIDNEKYPLVSVPVITYNSSATIIETLDSIYNQTYPNIELIVSDDCSPDNTVVLVRDWLKTHKDRFARTQLITVEKNTGVSGNCNRSGAACTGVWSKGIAGDDVMLPNCIQDCMDYVTAHPDVIWLFGKVEAFGSTEEENKRVAALFDYTFFSMTPEEQLHRLIFVGNCLPAPASFIHIQRNRATRVKNDERIPLLEDWPKWINLIRAGVRLHFVDKTIVKYRVTAGALSTGRVLSENHKKSIAKVFIYYQFPYFYHESDDKLAIVRRYVQAKKFVTGNYFWFVINRLMKICGVK